MDFYIFTFHPLQQTLTIRVLKSVLRLINIIGVQVNIINPDICVHNIGIIILERL